MEPGGFCLQSVRDFMLQKNGKVKNHQLVAQFKHYLNDPVEKGVNRDKFKDYVNTLATIKLDDNGEKVLVLKKKYREGGSAAGQLSTPTHTGSTPSSSTYPYGGSASPTTPTTPGAPGTPYSPLIPPAYDSYMSPGVDPTRGMYAESSVAYPHTQSPDLPVSSGGGYRNQYQEPLSNVYPTSYNQRPMDRGYQDDYRDVPGSGYQDPYRRGSSGGGYQEPYRHSPRDDFKEPGTRGYQDQYKESPRSAAYQDDYRQSPGNGFQDPYRRGSNSSGGFQESYGQMPRNDFQEVYRHSPAELPLPDQTRRGSYQDNQYQQSPQRRGFEEQDGGGQVPKRLYNDPYRRSPDRGMEAPRRGSEDVYRQSPDVPVEGRRAGFQEGYRNSPERSVEVVEKAQEGPKKETTEEAQGPNKAGEVTEEKEVMSVKERAKHLNKIQSETELQRVQLRKRDPKPKAAHDDDDSSTASVTLTDVEREWMMLSSKCDYHPMAKILLTNPQLAKKPDFTNVSTLIWNTY
ncbi:uncharacterized protein LOC106171560 [Lingula anatina]|uniref:Uncharacterized protein LOC106171560 n=1 Tax=Lingula anatina TaxID=7574 RepID=A0A1S3JAI3_LINAN|nr:uncharacterized protein LOC106171560 [Lingula anatina]|eukprot:XP_013407415.1 uncharacterized protein LOC106171560 [Lingula anatina]